MENTPLSSHGPYSSSKASADHFVMVFHDTYGMPINMTRDAVIIMARFSFRKS